jgi:CheY-like chemotaxis protein
VYGIVGQSEGFVSLYSEPGLGTTVKLYFPQVDVAPAAGPARAPAPARPARGTETVLIVEDDAAVRSLVRTVLANLGYHVLDANSADGAISVASAHTGPIHLLLTDVVMPHVSGRELARRLTTDRPRMRVLYMSGYDDAIVQRGAVDRDLAFLQKPITPEILLRKVREVLD